MLLYFYKFTEYFFHSALRVNAKLTIIHNFCLLLLSILLKFTDFQSAKGEGQSKEKFVNGWAEREASAGEKECCKEERAPVWTKNQNGSQ